MAPPAPTTARPPRRAGACCFRILASGPGLPVRCLSPAREVRCQARHRTCRHSPSSPVASLPHQGTLPPCAALHWTARTRTSRSGRGGRAASPPSSILGEPPGSTLREIQSPHARRGRRSPRHRRGGTGTRAATPLHARPRGQCRHGGKGQGPSRAGPAAICACATVSPSQGPAGSAAYARRTRWPVAKVRTLRRASAEWRFSGAAGSWSAAPSPRPALPTWSAGSSSDN